MALAAAVNLPLRLIEIAGVNSCKAVVNRGLLEV
jgi:hypothetical protein